MKSSLLHLQAIFYALCGFGLWVFSDAFMKLAGEANLPPYEVVAFFGSFVAITMVAISVVRGRKKNLIPIQPQKQILRGLMAFGCVMANTVALKHLPLTQFYIMVFTSPMIVTVLAAFFLHEPLTMAKIIAVLVGFAGVVVAINPWRHFGGGDWIGYSAAFCSALFFGFSTVLTGKIGRAGSVESMILITGVIEAVLGFGLMLLWQAVPFSPKVWLLLAAMGSISAIGNYCNALALRHTTAAAVEQFHYTQIITGALVGYFIWRDVPSLPVVIGAIIIILSGLHVAAQEHKAKVLAATVLGNNSLPLAGREIF